MLTCFWAHTCSLSPRYKDTQREEPFMNRLAVKPDMRLQEEPGNKSRISNTSGKHVQLQQHADIHIHLYLD